MDARENRYALTKRHVLLLCACDDFNAGAHAELDNVKNVNPARFVLKKRYRFVEGYKIIIFNETTSGTMSKDLKINVKNLVI